MLAKALTATTSLVAVSGAVVYLNPSIIPVPRNRIEHSPPESLKPIYLKNKNNKLLFVGKITYESNDNNPTVKDVSDEKNYSCFFDNSKNNGLLKKSVNQLFDCKLYSISALYKDDLNVEINELSDVTSRNAVNSMTYFSNSKEKFLIFEIEKNEQNKKMLEELKSGWHSKIFVINKPIYSNANREQNFYDSAFNRYFFGTSIYTDEFETNKNYEITSKYFLINNINKGDIFSKMPKTTKCLIKEENNEFDCNMLAFEKWTMPDIAINKDGHVFFTNARKKGDSYQNFFERLRLADKNNKNDKWYVLKIENDKKSNSDFYGKTLQVSFDGSKNKKEFKIYNLLLGFTKVDENSGQLFDHRSSMFVQK